MNTYRAESGSFLKISQVFGNQKWLIITITFLFTLLTGIVVYKSKTWYESYEAVVIVAPPLMERESILDKASFIYLQSLREDELNASELFNFFTLYSTSLSIRNLFYLQVYLPLFHPEVIPSLLPNDIYREYLRKYRTFSDYSRIQKKLIIRASANSSIDAVNALHRYIDYANLKANAPYNFIKVVRINILAFELWQQISILKKIEAASKKNNLNNSTYVPSIAPLFIERYQEKLNSLDTQIKTNEPINLFNYDSEITVRNLTIESKFKTILILGLTGGLILGFFAASLRIGIKSSQK